MLQFHILKLYNYCFDTSGTRMDKLFMFFCVLQTMLLSYINKVSVVIFQAPNRKSIGFLEGVVPAHIAGIFIETPAPREICITLGRSPEIFHLIDVAVTSGGGASSAKDNIEARCSAGD